MLRYNLVIRIYGAAIKVASIRKTKARQWVQGRKNWRTVLRKRTATLTAKKRVLVHCASYGEFEQGRPLMEAIRAKHPEYNIVLSFFSPSGYESFKHWDGADLICYLPLDTSRNARDFLQILKPDLAIFIKYEFWVNFLFELKKQEIPSYLVSAVFKPHHPFFKAYGGLFRRSLDTFNRLFIQDEGSARLLDGIGIKNYEVSGDTRFDRVLDIKNKGDEIEGISEFKGSKKLIVAGSTWPGDENLLLLSFLKIGGDVKLVLAPHNIDDTSVNEAVNLVKKHGLSVSLYSKGVDSTASVLVLDTMGMLSRIYYYADCAYVGGGFNEGLHNTLEPAVYGIPVAFYGDEYIKYNEAVALLESKAGANVKDEEELTAAFKKFLFDDQFRLTVKNNLEKYFAKNANSTSKVLEAINF